MSTTAIRRPAIILIAVSLLATVAVFGLMVYYGADPVGASPILDGPADRRQ